jgi:hypothetical protein
MSVNKPSNWYDMDHDQRRAWERQAREAEDLEYERDRARRALEDAEGDHRRARAAARAELSGVQEMMESVAEDLARVQAELDLARTWIRENGHWEAFDDWSSERRSE